VEAGAVELHIPTGSDKKEDPSKTDAVELHMIAWSDMFPCRTRYPLTAGKKIICRVQIRQKRVPDLRGPVLKS
jgi:hypothetical protein